MDNKTPFEVPGMFRCDDCGQLIERLQRERDEALAENEKMRIEYTNRKENEG